MTDDASQRRTLYSKLLPEIRDRITSYNDVPETREDLISLATRLEGSDAVNAKAARNDKRNREAHEQERDEKRPKRDRDHSDRRKSPAPLTRTGNPTATDNQGRQRFSEVNRTPVGAFSNPIPGPRQCYKCKKLGHGANQCPEVVCYSCNKKGHISPNCPEANRSGKGGAQS